MNNTNLKSQIAEAFRRSGGRPIQVLMLFFNELELRRSRNPDAWVNTRNIYFSDEFAALDAYAETRCPASQLTDGESPEELETKMLGIIKNFQDTNWLRTELYPSL